jgi:hypothetical protein
MPEATWLAAALEEYKAAFVTGGMKGPSAGLRDLSPRVPQRGH